MNGALRGFLAVGCALIANSAIAMAWVNTTITQSERTASGVVTGIFTFRNDSTATVAVESVLPSCDCVSAQASQRSYGPGEQGTIVAQFSIAGLEGKVEKTIKVVTTDAPNRPTVLTMVVQLPQPFVISPRFLFWHIGEDSAEKEIVITATGSEKSRLEQPQNSNPLFNVRLVASNTDGQYRVVIRPIATGSPIQTVIRLHARSPESSRVLVLYAAVK